MLGRGYLSPKWFYSGFILTCLLFICSFILQESHWSACLVLTYTVCSTLLVHAFFCHGVISFDMHEIFSPCISKGISPDELKIADISSIFKSVDSTTKENYRPASILKSVSKLFEKMIQSQLNTFFDEKLSQHLCGYRKGYTTQYALLKLIESWKKYRDNNGYSAAVLMDLSKAFDLRFATCKASCIQC